MKWYFALNEAGTSGGIGLHARLAVLSALKVGGLEPHLLYYGARNDYIAWMEAQGVRVIDAAPSFLDALEQAAREGRHPAHFIGHWLRTAICLIERDDDYILYTDCDVLFRRRMNFAACRPDAIACAPEFKPDNWNYFNSGVMVQNVPRLRRDHPAFQAFIVDALHGPDARDVSDQWAYNHFYRGSWVRLNPLMNWKPYWGFSADAPLVHFHGPKLDNMRAILDGAMPWENPTQRVIGSLFLAFMPHYIAALDDLLVLLGAFEDRPLVEAILRDARALYRMVPVDRIDLSVLENRMFDDA
ncbi:MAG: hypothetical protein JO209_04590 [Acidisphaera sp.]|nr:hypothetical protein [Acidisphaera sp.]